MQILGDIVQVALALVLLNVWLLRFNQSTGYRGGNARSMPEEFAVYGLPLWAMYVVGTLKVGAALCLIAGIWVRSLILPASLVIGVLMVGACVMHLKVHDSPKKFVPAGSLLLMSLLIGYLTMRS